MLTQASFVDLVKSQFAMYESIANGVFWNGVRASKSSWMGLSNFNPKKQLTTAADSVYAGLQMMADSYISQFSEEVRKQAVTEKKVFLAAVRQILNATNVQVLQEIKSESLKQVNRQIEHNPIFAQLNLKRMDSIGRGYNALYSIELSARHFTVLVSLERDYVRFKAQGIKQVDIMRDDIRIKTIELEDLHSEETIKLFHPNSKLRIEAHVTETQSNG